MDLDNQVCYQVLSRSLFVKLENEANIDEGHLAITSWLLPVCRLLLAQVLNIVKDNAIGHLESSDICLFVSKETANNAVTSLIVLIVLVDYQ